MRGCAEVDAGEQAGGGEPCDVGAREVEGAEEGEGLGGGCGWGGGGGAGCADAGVVFGGGHVCLGMGWRVGSCCGAGMGEAFEMFGLRVGVWVYGGFGRIDGVACGRWVYFLMLMIGIE